MSLRYYPTIAVVRSGLSEHSHGDGRNRKTVLHAKLADEFEAGTLRRRAGQLLCRAGQTRLWLGQESAEVDCPKCLQMLGRHAGSKVPRPAADADDEPDLF